jgi:hypothetical protein
MSRTLTVSDELYTRLEATARERGLPGVEQLLEAWQAVEEERGRRAQVVQQIDALRARLFATYGEMPDSTPLVHEDRER